LSTEQYSVTEIVPHLIPLEEAHELSGTVLLNFIYHRQQLTALKLEKMFPS